MKLTDPSLTLEFLGNDLEPGHSTTQTLGDTELIRGSFQFKEQRLNGLKSSSDQVTLQIRARCSSTEDIIATDGDIKAVLKDGDTPLFTGYVSTRFSWSVTANGEQAINITLESIGTRLFDNPFIETGKHFFDCTASAAIYTVLEPLGISIRSGDERRLLQNVKKVVDAGETCRQILDQLLYECNAVYYFNEVGEFCIWPITSDTTGVPTYDSQKLMMVDKKVVSLSKQLRTYKGARVAYNELGQASNYLIYRNTTGQGAGVPYCNLVISPGYYWDGADMYTPAEWSAATADTFREPTLIGAVNAASESSIVGSGEIVNISNLRQRVEKNSAITFSAEIVGGPYFKMLAHNTSGSYSATITRLDLSADITYVKSHGVIRTQIDGSSDNKTTLEEELSWIHDKDNASLHANLLAQYHKSAGAAYTFYTKQDIFLGSVIKIHDDVFSGLEVYVLVTSRQGTDKNDVYTYTAVGISTFDLSERAYHGTTEPAKQSGAQGPAGEPGASMEVEYAIGSSIVNPPGETMQWGGADMLWDGETMYWNTGTWEGEVPDMERGQYIWMRTRIGDEPWQYSRLTGSTSWDAENLGVCTTATPTQSKEGLGLIPGDYFVAGATFPNPSTGPYMAGYAYTYNGTSWTGLDLTTAENARKASDLLSTLASTNTQIPSSNSQYSVWLWASNFVAQNAVIDNLFSQAITILSGGFIKGGDRYNDDGTENDTTENGFWFSADGRLKALLQSDSSRNTLVGTNVAFMNDDNGGDNTAMGYEALYGTSQGSDCVAIGSKALHAAGRSYANVAVGSQSLYKVTGDGNSSGEGNVAVGHQALYNTNAAHSGANYNVAVGFQALDANTEGNYNIGIGAYVDNYNNTGRFQVNFNNCLRYAEFKSSRSGAEIYAYLAAAFTTSMIVPAMGWCDGAVVSAIRYNQATGKIYFYGRDGSQTEEISSSTTATFNLRTCLWFLDPSAPANTTRGDSLETAN